MAINIRSKGQRGEREAIAFITDWATPVTRALGWPDMTLSRNLVQSRSGGYDILGIDWLALEIKRHETLNVATWWKQTIKQTGDGQVPLLMYRQNNQRWRFRVKLHAAHYSPCGFSGVSQLVADLEEAQAKVWFQMELYTRIAKASVPEATEAIRKVVADPPKKVIVNPSPAKGASQSKVTTSWTSNPSPTPPKS